ncbi:MAG: secondary thiamine-phosphate synthase enzyme YjbQ [Calditrichia bacterium]|nr:secondary thiamine-phosphate synthase enzyme YjbQ [Calditrichia bacterium]
MDIYTEYLSLQSRGFNDIIDISSRLNEILHDSGFTEGQMTIFVSGSTAGLTTIEYEPGLLRDLPEFFEGIIPMKKSYHHDQTWHDGNGYAHLRSSLIKPFFTVPFQAGRLLLGTWQQVVFIDFDNRPRQRKLVVQMIGIKKAG